MTAGASDRQPRLADMDAMGVDQRLLYPTWFAEGFFLVGDPDVAYALARGYNDWVADFCAAAPRRLFAAAILPLQNMDFALEELQRVAAMPSFRAVFIRPMFVEDRYFNHPYYDPLWAELDRLGITACSRHCPAGAADRSPAAAAARPAPRPLPAPRRSATRWRRSSPIGSTTTCSSPRR